LTPPTVEARRHHWLRAIGYGLLAELATIATIVVIVLLYRYVLSKGLSDSDYAAFGDRVGGIVGIVGGTLYTFLFARALMRRLSARFIEHGVIVAVAAIALSVGGSLAGHHGVPTGYLIASLLKLAAGASAGFIAARASPPQPA
jgi:hypothetical protein